MTCSSTRRGHGRNAAQHRWLGAIASNTWLNTCLVQTRRETGGPAGGHQVNIARKCRKDASKNMQIHTSDRYERPAWEWFKSWKTVTIGSATHDRPSLRIFICASPRQSTAAGWSFDSTIMMNSFATNALPRAAVEKLQSAKV